jgi:hypothetical protein
LRARHWWLRADPATKDEAFSAIRTLADEVKLVPDNGEPRVEIRGATFCCLFACRSKGRRI